MRKVRKTYQSNYSPLSEEIDTIGWDFVSYVILEENVCFGDPRTIISNYSLGNGDKCGTLQRSSKSLQYEIPDSDMQKCA